MKDFAHEETDARIANLELDLKEHYMRSSDDMAEKGRAYFEKLKERDKEMRDALKKGKITEDQYTEWRKVQILRGEKYQAFSEKLAEDATKANIEAMAIVKGELPDIFALNANYTAYTIERAGANVDFSLYDKSTVERLVAEIPDLLPDPSIDIPRDMLWNKKHIDAEITASVLQGERIERIAERLRTITDMNERASIRNARTAMTCAQNSGRQYQYERAVKMGIKVRKQWLATLDGRTRHEHAMLDGQIVEYDKPFKYGFVTIMYPGDTSAPPQMIYNCRCTTIAILPDVDTSDALRRDKNGLLPDMTFAQWEASKREYEVDPISKYNIKQEATAKDVTVQYIKNSKKTGKIRYESGYKKGTHKAEVEAAEILHSTFGGKIILLKESNAHGEKTPDYLWNRKLWELKSISSSKAVDSALRVGMKQIRGNAGGVVLSCADSIDYQDLILRMDDRALRGKLAYQFDVVALKNGIFWFARRYKK